MYRAYTEITESNSWLFLLAICECLQVVHLMTLEQAPGVKVIGHEPEHVTWVGI